MQNFILGLDTKPTKIFLMIQGCVWRAYFSYYISPACGLQVGLFSMQTPLSPPPPHLPATQAETAFYEYGFSASWNQILFGESLSTSLCAPLELL